MNKDLPRVFVFAKNEMPSFDVLKEGIAWRTIPNIDRYTVMKNESGITLRITRSEHKDIIIDSLYYYQKHMQKFKSLISCS